MQNLSLENQCKIEHEDNFVKNNTNEANLIEQEVVKAILNDEKIEIENNNENCFAETPIKIKKDSEEEKKEYLDFRWPIMTKTFQILLKMKKKKLRS